MSENETRFEREVRTMLRRRANDVGAAVPMLPLGDAVGVVRRPPASRRGSRWRMAAAAAMVAIAAVGVAQLVKDREQDIVVGSRSGSTLSALPDWFDPGTATAVFVTDHDEPRTAAEAYLKARFPDYPAPGVSVLEVEVDGSQALVIWALPAYPGFPYNGTVLLREDAGSWVVVAATTDGVDLSGIRRDGDRLVGVVADDRGIDLLALDIVSLDGEPIADAPYPDGYPGAEYEFGTAGTSGDGIIDVDLVVPGQEPVLVRVQHVGGTMLSIAELAVPAAPAGQPTVGRARDTLSAFGVSFDLPQEWSISRTDVVAFTDSNGAELHLDWTDDQGGEGRAVTTPSGNARLATVEGGLRLRIDVPCSWPACRRLDVFAYGFGEGAVAQQRLLDVVEGLTISGPQLRGSLEDGRPWTVHQDFERGLCVQIDQEPLGCDDSGPVVAPHEDPATPRVAGVDVLDLPEEQNGNLIYGFLPSPPLRPTVASLVRLDYADGRLRTEDIMSDPLTGLWAAPVVPGELPVAVTYLDETGQPVETHPLFD